MHHPRDMQVFVFNFYPELLRWDIFFTITYISNTVIIITKNDCTLKEFPILQSDKPVIMATRVLQHSPVTRVTKNYTHQGVTHMQ
jgi:hypothetical protein